MPRSEIRWVVLMLAVPTLLAGQTTQQKLAPPKKRSAAVASSRPADPPVRAEELGYKRDYAPLTISELASQDPSRWTPDMASHVTIGGFVTGMNREPDGDVSIRICDNPKVADMNRARCIEAKCIPKIPCEVPQVGRPINILGITRYDAAAGNHWWEINPIEQIEK